MFVENFVFKKTVLAVICCSVSMVIAKAIFEIMFNWLRIRVGFNANPDPAFYVNADLYPDLGSLPMRIHADPQH